ncbi:MAG TPA: hypothetical protein VMT16_16620 [Thermoanaerobaculia bacterium]|nr:hypothetical protein [Thermoanaerobaculia bacterium]
MHRAALVLPDDPALTRTIGAGAPTKRALRARLRRAEANGILPRRVYLSSQRFAYRADELAEALERLPRHHVEALGGAA